MSDSVGEMMGLLGAVTTLLIAESPSLAELVS